MCSLENSSQVSWWAFHRRLYDWVLSFAHNPHSMFFLFLLSFAESVFIPIAPDVLLIALSLERRKLTWIYALITTLGSVAGGMVGYAIGDQLWDLVSNFFFTHVFSENTFNEVGHLYNKYGFWAIFTAAFTPIPYKVFTISAGVFNIPFFTFVLASIIGRGARFFLVSSLIWRFGPPIKEFIDKYFNLLSIIFAAILLFGFFLLKSLSE